MKYLPHALITTGLFIVVVALWKIWEAEAADPLAELSRFMNDWRFGMECNRLNGRGRNIVLPEGWRP